MTDEAEFNETMNETLQEVDLTTDEWDFVESVVMSGYGRASCSRPSSPRPSRLEITKARAAHRLRPGPRSSWAAPLIVVTIRRLARKPVLSSASVVIRDCARCLGTIRNY
jgi:hypothetical protein